MSGLTIFGLFAVTAMIVFYALEKQSPHFVLAFAGACLMASAYGFMQGAWPFGVVEAIWSFVAVERWRRKLNNRSQHSQPAKSASDHGTISKKPAAPGQFSSAKES